MEDASNNLKLRYIYDLVKRGSVDEDIHTNYALILLQMISIVYYLKFNYNQILYQEMTNEVVTKSSSSSSSGEAVRDKLEPRLKDAHEAYFEPFELSELNLDELRYLLQVHLLKSTHYKGYEVLQILQDTKLYKEQVVVNLLNDIIKIQFEDNIILSIEKTHKSIKSLGHNFTWYKWCN